MVDTPRTRAELLTIFADGQAAGSITPQDQRDYVVSVPRGGGFADYGDLVTATTPITLVANTWTTLANDGAGASTNTAFLPTGVAQLMDLPSGNINTTDLVLGDTILIRTDYTVTPSTNNNLLEFRFMLGTGGPAFTLETIKGRLDSGGGNPYRFAVDSQLVYMGDTNTKDNPIIPQLRLSGAGSVVNAGAVISVLRR